MIEQKAWLFWQGLLAVLGGFDGVVVTMWFSWRGGGFPPGERAYAAGAPFLMRQKGWKKR